MAKRLAWRGSQIAFEQYQRAALALKPKKKKSKRKKKSLPNRRNKKLTDQQKRYRVYLKSNWWKTRREEAMNEANHRCEHCGSKIGLHVHHLNYRHLGEEQSADLQVLCKQCHRHRHDL
jgi:5-methylcytosine-specific restriction endonuclease McrA